MAGSGAFEAICTALVSAGMDRWTARGTLQLALMDAGLTSGTVTTAQLAIIVERLLPRQLQSQKGLDIDAVCAKLRDVLAMQPDADEESTITRIRGR